MLVGRITGPKLDKQTEELLRVGTAGGICIFKDNAVDIHQLAELIDSISSASCTNAIVCIDQEGGAVQRLDDILTPLPSLMAIAATDKIEHAKTAARINAQQLLAAGFNCVLSPVVDVASNPLNPIIGTRALSSRPETVSKCAKAMLESFSEAGIVSVVKHFPGHGDTGQDSHSELAVITRDKKSLEDCELRPYKDCLSIAPSVLVGHIWLTAYEEKPLPATLSSNLIEQVLRKEFAYDGLVMTDDMMMKAISAKYGLAESSVLSILAGVDLLLLCSSPYELEEAHKYIVEAVLSGRITEQRIIDANRRIEKLFPASKKISVNKNFDSRIDEIQLERKAVESIYRDSFTLLKGTQPEISKEAHWLVIAPDHPRYSLNLANYLEETFGLDKNARITFEKMRYAVKPGATEIDDIVKIAKDLNTILVTFRAELNPGQFQLAKSLADISKTFVGIAADIPYDAGAVGEKTTYICTFDPSEAAMKTLAKMLAEGKVFNGKNPVDMPIKASISS